MDCFLLPVNLDINEIKEFIQTKDIKHNQKYYERLLFVISTIATVHKKIEKPAEDYVNISSLILRHFVGKHEKTRVVEYLREMEIVEKDGGHRFSPNGFGWCEGYRFFPKYRTATQSVPTDFMAKILKKKGYYGHRPKGAKAGQMTTMDRESEDYLNANFQLLSFKENTADFITKNFSGQNKKLAEGYLRRIGSKEIKRVKQSPNSKRLDSIIANMPRELRENCLLLDGLPMVEVDISNCQPLLMTKLYKKASGEYNVFKAIVEKGKFIAAITKYLTKVYEKELPPNKAAKRIAKLNSLKGLFLQFVSIPVQTLATYKDSMVKDMERFFEEYCPELNMAIKNFKMVSRTKLLCHLQQLEAELMLMHIVPTLRNKGIKALPLHDAILCHEEHKDTVAQIIKEECQKLYGLIPTIKFKGCATETLTATPPPEPVKSVEPLVTPAQPAYKFPVLGADYRTFPKLFVHGLESKNSFAVEKCMAKICDIFRNVGIYHCYKWGIFLCCENHRLHDFKTIVEKRVKCDFGFVPQLSFDDVWKIAEEKTPQRIELKG